MMRDASAPASLACLVITTMGRVLLQCERDTPLPFHYARLALLLASLIQFATSRHDFVRLELRHGVRVMLSVESTASVACAVLYASDAPSIGERARLTSLVVLRTFLTDFGDTVERFVAENRADAERMAEAYTLTSALDGGGSGDVGDVDRDGTMDAFIEFQHNVVERLLEQSEAPAPSIDAGKSIVYAHVMNAATGVSLNDDCDDAIDKCVRAEASRRLVRRAARALERAFPVVDGVVSGSPTLVLRMAHPDSPASNVDIVIRLFEHGVFAPVVYYYADSHSVFRGRDCELLRDGRLQRALASDPRGAALAQLVEDAATASCFSLHVGADGAMLAALAAADRMFQPWTLPEARPQ